MKKWLVTLYPIYHWRTPEGKELIRKQLLKQGLEVKSEYDGSLSVYEKAPIFNYRVICLLLIGLVLLIDVIVGNLILRGKV